MMIAPEFELSWPGGAWRVVARPGQVWQAWHVSSGHSTAGLVASARGLAGTSTHVMSRQALVGQAGLGAEGHGWSAHGGARQAGQGTAGLVPAAARLGAARRCKSGLGKAGVASHGAFGHGVAWFGSARPRRQGTACLSRARPGMSRHALAGSPQKARNPGWHRGSVGNSTQLER